MDQLLAITKKVSKGGLLEEILPTGYSGAKIAVVKGTDGFSRDTYLRDAYFSEWEAWKDVDKSSSFSTNEISDDLWVEMTTINQIENKNGNTKDQIYQKLTNKLSNTNKFSKLLNWEK